MTAIGALPEGIDETAVRTRITKITPDEVRGYWADVRQWIVGPYNGPSSPTELRIRAAVLVDLAVTDAAGSVPSIGLGSVPINTPEPGSVNDPAYSSAPPAPGPEGLNPQGGDATPPPEDTATGSRMAGRSHAEGDAASATVIPHETGDVETTAVTTPDEPQTTEAPGTEPPSTDPADA